MFVVVAVAAFYRFSFTFSHSHELHQRNDANEVSHFHPISDSRRLAIGPACSPNVDN